MQTTLLLASALGAAAFPHMARDSALNKASPLISRQDALGISKAQSNCGPNLCPTFDAEDQLVSVSGQNAFIAPGPGDLRGPCPGLNAAANHGYLPRSGIVNIEQAISGLGAAYQLGPAATGILAAYAIALDGNVAEGVWSIGGPLPVDDLTGALLGTGQGISYSHNNYEGDSSNTRNDAYVNHGDAYSLNITRFGLAYDTGVVDGSDRYTLDKFRQRFQANQQESVANNPYYFTGAFSTEIVVPAAYNFVINMMSNHTAEEPSGYFDGAQFKSFFSIVGEPGSFEWIPGHERIPDNWYRRPSYAPYSAPDVIADVAIGYLAYPDTLKFGGNTGTVNSFTGVDVGDLTGGVLDAATLFQGDNFACFSFQLLQEGIPDFLNNAINDLAPVTNLINKYVGPVVGGLSCPQLGQFDLGLFDQFPGYKYSPTAPPVNKMA